MNVETSSVEIPKVKVKAVRGRDGIWDLYITCPYCGKKHHHGGGNGDRPILGFRVAHCGADVPEHRGLQQYELA